MERSELDRLITRFGPDRVVRSLEAYVSEPRRERIEAVLDGRMRGVQVALEEPTDPHNAAAVVRTAEALGVLGVHVIGAEPGALHARSTTQGAYHWVSTRHHPDLATFLHDVRGECSIIAGADMEGPVTVDELPVDEPLLLLFGNEQRGLSDEARAACDVQFRIPMFGMSQSLNLSVSAAISLYDVTTRRRALAGKTDLTPDDRARLRARYYLRALDERLIRGLFGGQEMGEEGAA